MVNAMDVPPSREPQIEVDDMETHFEWLVRLVTTHDRRTAPFEYQSDPPRSERRRWDLVASLRASR
jgi:hypothetical protein